MAGDWLDNVDVTPPPAGQKTGGDWLDNVDVTPSAGPSVGERFGFRPAGGAEGVVARSGIRALTAPSSAVVGAMQGLGGWLERKGISAPTPSLYDTGGQQLTGEGAPAQPPPSEAIIHGLGLDAPADQGTGSKIAEEILPWLVPSGNQFSRVREVPGLFNKAMTLGRSELGNVTDWAASTGAQELAEKYGFGPLASMIAGFAGGNARGVVTRALTPVVRAIIPAKEGAGETVDVSKKLLPARPGGTSTLPAFTDVAEPDSSATRFVTGAGALPFSGTGAASAEKARTAAITRTADAALQTLDPGTTPVTKAGPSSVRQEGSTIANQARDAIMNEEQRLMAKSDAIEGQIGLNTRVDAQPLITAAEDLATHPDVGTTVQNQARKVLDNIHAATGADGKVSFGALKNERSTFAQFIDGLLTAPTGDVTIKNSLARALQPVKDAMTERMGAAADSVSQQLGAAWRGLDSEWTSHGAMKHHLAETGGVLTPDRTSFDPSPGGKTVAKTLSGAVSGGGKQGTAPIERIEKGLDEQPARSGVAETVAAMGQPAGAKAPQGFRPDVFAQGVSQIDPDVLAWIQQKAGAQARQQLEDAARAGAPTGKPQEPGGWSKAFGNVMSALPYVGTAAAIHSPAAVLSPIVSMLLSASNDPDFIRTVANRNNPVSALVPQALQHAALSTNPNAVDPAAAFHYGVGQAANAGRAGLSAAISSIPELLKYLSTAPQVGGQR